MNGNGYIPVAIQDGYVDPATTFSPMNSHDVLQKMDVPDSIAVLNDAFIFAYRSVSINEPQLGFAIPSFDFFKLTVGSAIANHNYHFYAFTLDGDIVNLQNSHLQITLRERSSFGLIFVLKRRLI